MGWVSGNIFYLAPARYRRVALESLAIAFPNKPAKERKKIAKDSIVMMMQSGLELLFCVRNHKIFDNIRFEGKQYLDEAFKRNKGVVGVTAHFGNFPMMTAKFANSGYTVNAIARPMRDPQAGDYIYDLRKGFGIKTIFSYPRKVVVGDTIKALRNNELVLIQMDQNFGTGGVWVDFFGKLAATPVGPIVFALRTGAALLPVFMVREGFGRHCIKILPPCELEKTDNTDETVLLNAIKITKTIEQWVRNYPEHWGWIHRRWKSRPSEQMKKARFKVQKI